MSGEWYDESERPWTRSSQLGRLEARVAFNEGQLAGLAPHTSPLDWLYRLLLPGLFTVCMALVGVIWWNLNGQIAALQTDVGGLKTQNTDSAKQVAALTQQIKDLVDTIKWTDGAPVGWRKK